MLHRWRRRRALLRDPFPPAWREVLRTALPHWHVLDAREQEQLEELTLLLIADKRWEAARGFELTDEVQVTIAGNAALLVLELGYEVYRNVGTIIVHAETMRERQVRPGPAKGTVTDEVIAVLGVTHYDGPVIIAWDAAQTHARAADGDNVILHEFAHKIDMLDAVIDGTPPLPRREDHERWVAVFTAEYEALRAHGDALLGDYAGTNPAEFFAVATERFFERPLVFEADKPELYAVLRDFYGQDPARRL